MRGVHRTLAAVALFAAAGLAQAHEGHTPKATAAELAASEVAPEVHRHAGPPVLGAGFALTDDRGRSVTDETYRGKWMLVFFGYTGCREACPIGLDTLSRMLDVLGADAEKVQPLFIDFSLDAPDQATLAQFVSNFHPSIIGLTGTREQTIAAVRQYKVRREYKFGNYSRKETGMRIDHTTVVYLVDPEGKHRAYFRHDMKPEEMAKAIRNHL